MGIEVRTFASAVERTGRLDSVAVGAGLVGGKSLSCRDARQQHNDRHGRPHAVPMHSVDAVAVREAKADNNRVRTLAARFVA
jgi:hypothetical protein